MKALILVAGHGARLVPAIGETPKALLEIGGRSLLDRQIDLMTELGVERICLATGYHHEAFASRYGDRVDYRYNPFYRESNNIISFLFARDWVMDSDLVVCYGDLLYQPEVLEAALWSPAESALVIDRGRVEEGHALISLKGGNVAEIGRSIPVTSADARFVGISKFAQRGISPLMQAIEAAVRAGKLGDYYLAGVEQLIQEGHAVSPIDVTGCPWTEIDYPEDLDAARRDWA
ncbi:phosphocholine cytidylyltransferase family protein [Rhizobium leguminosarum]|uniref:phosphocholine cytidylyltransferase family protein n=1 Tax=Rhizobium leguminosarum TaxID=384 RepID=UPI001C902C16|nr:phosphocholine cytidylyltransferase family protein [Rhizobium leguminosarum]MBY3179501.1 phosphocholine cytidylyltransferase family protein [Rhizobium leguminosarum]MBY5735524.1 phosphocholine cytidylyltransferase family protein [Rhizobium leguminosarum]